VCAACEWGDRLGSKVYKGRGVSLRTMPRGELVG
jgi:hypothetical protein